MASGSNHGTSTGRSSHGADQDTYDPQHWGVRNIAARDGYDAGDGYMIPAPQLWNQPATSDQRSSGYQSNQHQRPRRRDSTLDSESDEEDDYNDRRGRSSRGLRKYKSFEQRRYYDDEDEDDRDRGGDRGRDRNQNRGSLMRRSMSQLRTTIKDAFGGDEEEDGAGNSQTKKLAATLSGAVVGGLAGRQARKDHWVPAAIGAFIGGFAARELEKQYYRRKDTKREDPYEGRSKSRSRSRG